MWAGGLYFAPRSPYEILVDIHASNKSQVHNGKQTILQFTSYPMTWFIYIAIRRNKMTCIYLLNLKKDLTGIEEHNYQRPNLTKVHLHPGC